MPRWHIAQMTGCPDQAWCSRRHLVAEALWTLMHINEIGYAIPRQKLSLFETTYLDSHIYTEYQINEY